MNQFRRIFVAIDFSPASDEALRQAHERAQSKEATLAVCHIVPNEMRSNILFPHISRIADLQFPLEMRSTAEAAASRVMEVTGRTANEFELMVDDGAPQALILSHAEDWKADVVIVGSHGQTSAADALLGSVTSSVIRHAHSPVLIVRAGKGTGKIIAGTDFSEPAMQAIKAAANEAKRTEGPLTVVQSLDLVWSAASYPAMAFGGAPFNISPAQIEELEAIATKRIEETLAELKIDGEALVTTGAAGAALIEVASKANAALIVVGTVGRTGLRRALLGSVAETVATGAPCSVLIVR